MRSIEICAGAGGQALGLEQAGFEHVALVEIDKAACATLRANRPRWHVLETDVVHFSAKAYEGIDLLSGGVPCPPFSVAGKQLGQTDERDLFPQMIRLIRECKPTAVMIENVRGLLDAKFDDYRKDITRKIERQGYTCQWALFNACDFGVPQLRPRTVMVALKKPAHKYFRWPDAKAHKKPPTVGEALWDEMASNGWKQAGQWAQGANHIAPTLVGGSKKHGGADLGPTRAKKAWESLGVDGKGLANEAPTAEFTGMPRLTVEMAALLQGFPPDWHFSGKKTAAYRQVGNAFPPAVAQAVGQQIRLAIEAYTQALKKKEVEFQYGGETLGLAR